MNRIHIDFAGRGRRARWAGRILAVLAVAMCAEAALSYRDARATLEAAEGRLAQAGPRAAPVPKLAAEEVALVRDTLERLAMPWERLFGALEAAATEDVALLGIEPDPKAGTVVISGDSKSYLAALSYVLNLSRAESFNRVQLVRHEVKPNDPQGPVSFAVSADWAGARR